MAACCPRGPAAKRDLDDDTFAGGGRMAALVGG
jgi:hypothetical protein